MSTHKNKDKTLVAEMPANKTSFLSFTKSSNLFVQKYQLTDLHV
jgi:hypothetical protein